LKETPKAEHRVKGNALCSATRLDITHPAMAIFSQDRLQTLEVDELALLLATQTPTPTQNAAQRRQNRLNRPKPKTPSVNIEATLKPIIPQKRQKTLEEREELYEFRANSRSSIFSSTTRSPSVIPATPIGTHMSSTPSILDIKAIVQSAISPLILELRDLKEEIKQLKAAPLNTAGANINIKKAKEAQQTPKSFNTKGTEKASTTEAQTQATKTKPAVITPIAKKPTYAAIASGDPKQAGEKITKPWTLIQKKRAIPTAELAPKKATEPCQRRIIFQRQKGAIRGANLPNLLLALNKAMKEWGLPDHIRLIKLDYTGTGAISGLLADKATAAMVIPLYSDALIKVAIQHDISITGVNQAEEWYKLRVHRVHLERYLENPEGLQLAKEEIEATQSLQMPLMPQWLANQETIRKRYHNREINFSTIVITVPNKLVADKLMAQGLYFGGHNHMADRYWETGPEEICPKCLEYGHTSFGGCSKTPKCYICAGNHQANEHKCPITGCSTPVGKACIHLPIKCINCKGPHFAISNNCPKKRAVIEEAKRKKQDIKRLKESRRHIQVLLLKKPEAITTPQSAGTPDTTIPSSAKEHEMELDNLSQTEAQLQAQLHSDQ
jgi:hypothetical protein